MTKLTATELWCRITNALVIKYKTMADESPNKATVELLRLEGTLIANGFLSREELERGL